MFIYTIAAALEFFLHERNYSVNGPPKLGENLIKKREILKFSCYNESSFWEII